MAAVFAARRRPPRQPRPPDISEKDWQDQVVSLARYCGWLTYHTYDSRRSVPGVPDLLLVRPPRVLFVELKSRTGRVSPAQQAWLDLLGACPGVEARLWRPADIDQVRAVLDRRWSA